MRIPPVVHITTSYVDDSDPAPWPRSNGNTVEEADPRDLGYRHVLDIGAEGGVGEIWRCGLYDLTDSLPEAV
jgi:hypothetical protein